MLCGHHLYLCLCLSISVCIANSTSGQRVSRPRLETVTGSPSLALPANLIAHRLTNIKPMKRRKSYRSLLLLLSVRSLLLLHSIWFSLTCPHNEKPTITVIVFVTQVHFFPFDKSSTARKANILLISENVLCKKTINQNAQRGVQLIPNHLH